MIIVTAYDEAFSEVGDLCAESILRYCYRQKDHNPYIMPLIPAGRPMSWEKIGIIKWLLKRCKQTVLWVDADAIIVGADNFSKIIREDCTLNIAMDAAGINCGVMAWNPVPQAIEALDRMESMYEKYADHCWYEQAALMEFIGDLSVHYQKKEIWNAYPSSVTGGGDVTTESMVIHWPGCDADTRAREMKEVLLNQVKL